LCHLHDTVVYHAVGCNDAVEISHFRRVVSQRRIRNVGHSPAGFPENSFGPAGIPQMCAMARVHVKMGAPFANDSNFQSDAAHIDGLRNPETLADRLHTRGAM
jgi:hypothetical protein